MVHILLAVDGTYSSSEYNVDGNRSYVRRFYDRFSGGPKRFFEGPGSGTMGGIRGLIGTDVDDIEERAWAALRGLIRSAGDRRDTRIALVGHSRGGHIVCALARRLVGLHVGSMSPSLRAPTMRDPSMRAQRDRAPAGPTYRVHFLGLYDAVDMTWNAGNTDQIPSNVDWYAHAMRSPELGSRSSWGNTGMATLCSQRIQTHFYRATHGAIGGAASREDGTNRSLPSACGDSVSLTGGDYCNVSISQAQNAREATRANNFILGHARSAGLPV